ncbi:hypothetical protein GCM10010344_00870 [Streptomyces bluensis]|nr:hypothetical protein GCM10010344_00870 [Streptomyces bluensis]
MFSVFTQAGTVLMADSFDGERQVAQQVPAVSCLNGVRGGLPDGAGVGAGPIAAHDLGTGMAAKPRGQRLGPPIWQNVDGLVGFDIDEDRSEAAAAAEGELVHAEHTWGPVRRGRSGQVPKKPHPTCWN